MAMLMRQTLPGGVPAWDPWAGRRVDAARYLGRRPHFPRRHPGAGKTPKLAEATDFAALC